MGANFLKIDKGINFKGQTSAPSSPANGDIYYDTTRNTFVQYNNGNWSDLQSRSDVVSASSLTSTNFTASVVQSSFIRVTGSTSGNIHGLTASSGSKSVVVYNQSSVLQTLKSQSATEGTAGNRIITPTGADTTLSSGQSAILVYDDSQSRWVVVSVVTTGGGSGGSKNYLSSIVTSQSSTANTGNGNFELGSTAGWSLAHSTLSSVTPTSVASAGTPFDSTHGGSTASANMSLVVSNTGVLQGTYAGHLSQSPSPSIAGDMLISNSFNIDNSDQAKVLTFKFSYNWGTGTGNFSGTSSNSWAVWIYDVTNGAWIQPAGVYGMTQSVGNAYCTGTFQTTANSTAYQIALININAVATVYDLYVDDFSVGPQTAPLGVAATDWVQYSTATTGIVGFGTPTSVSLFSRRVADTLEVRGKFTSGTPTATVAQIPIGFNGVLQNVTVDTTKGSTSNNVLGVLLGGVATAASWYILGPSTNSTFVNIGQQASGSNGNNAANGNGMTIVSGDIVDFSFSVPIVGWSSNVQMSNDTDTRVVAATYYMSANTTPGTNTQINFNTQVLDTHAAVTTGVGAWKFTAPVSGYYNVDLSVVMNSATSSSLFLYKNGSQFSYINGSAAAGFYFNGSIVMQLNAGDFIDARINSGATLTGGSSPMQSYISINRLSGPSVVAATESVNAAAINTSGQALSTGVQTTVTGWTKQFDTHNAFSTGGVFTVPVAGKYMVTLALAITPTVANVNGLNAYIVQAGSASYTAMNRAPVENNTGTNVASMVTHIFNCAAGDTLTLQALQDNNTSINMWNSDNQRVRFSIAKVG